MLTTVVTPAKKRLRDLIEEGLAAGPGRLRTKVAVRWVKAANAALDPLRQFWAESSSTAERHRSPGCSG